MPYKIPIIHDLSKISKQYETIFSDLGKKRVNKKPHCGWDDSSPFMEKKVPTFDHGSWSSPTSSELLQLQVRWISRWLQAQKIWCWTDLPGCLRWWSCFCWSCFLSAFLLKFELIPSDFSRLKMIIFLAVLNIFRLLLLAVFSKGRTKRVIPGIATHNGVPTRTNCKY